jgi:aspartyl/glutamyl-tRNA(Asn/Gln) amidotransferase C subunit
MNKDEFLNLCELSKLKYSEEEAETVMGEIDLYLEKFDLIKNSPLEGNEDYYENVASIESLRSDDVIPFQNAPGILKNASETRGEFFSIPLIIDENES